MNHTEMTKETGLNLNHEIASSKLLMLVKQNAVTIFASNMLIPVIVAGILFSISSLNDLSLYLWIGFGFVLGIGRFIHHKSLKIFHAGTRSIRSWENDLIVLSALSGLFWSTSGILFMDPETPSRSLVLIAAQLGVIAGAVPALASHARMFFAFVLSTWAPSGLYYLTIKDPFFLGMGIVGSIFVVIVISFSASQRRAVNDSFKLRFENLELLEELQIQKQKAEDANSAKSRFLAVASHDLRQPIHAMRLFSDSLSQRIEDESSRATMQMLSDSIETLSGLFDSLLDISKLDAAAIEPDIVPVNPSYLLESLSVELRLQCQQRGLECRLKCPPDLYINTDPVLLERILRNIIWNAIKYTDSGGILIAARKRQDKLRIEIWDTGCGIPKTEVGKIFDEFHQVDRPMNEAREGIGLGLSIVNRLCQLLDFKVSLRSTPGKGTVFFVEMPLTEKPRHQTAHIPTKEMVDNSGDTDISGVHILVVDDEENIRTATCHLLRDWHCEPLPVASAKQAVSALDSFTPDIILSDYHLKNSVSGDEVIRLVNEELGYDVPSIIITGDTSPQQIQNAKALGFELMHKPIQPELLKRHIIRLLNT